MPKGNYMQGQPIPMAVNMAKDSVKLLNKDNYTRLYGLVNHAH